MLNPMPRLSVTSSGRARRAFTLIELLVVIAIISILVALLFPVFATARESARESATSTHLHEIQNALALYKLDNKSYPPVLFAYADGVIGHTMGSAVQNTGAAPGQDPAYLSGLYPTYVKDWHDFTCPNNLVDDPAAVVAANVNLNVGGVMTPTGTATYPKPNFYAMDAMDISPQINTGASNQLVGGNNTTNWVWLPRYQTSWQSYRTSDQFPTSSTCMVATPPASCLSQAQFGIYTRQLRWTNPPPNTYVTSLTYHVPNRNVVMVLYESGTVVTTTKIGTGNPTLNYDDSANTIAASGGATPDSSAQFWQFSANQ